MLFGAEFGEFYAPLEIFEELFLFLNSSANICVVPVFEKKEKLCEKLVHSFELFVC